VEPPDGPRWGIIQHVTSRDKLRFQIPPDGSIQDVLEFIRKHSAESELSLPFALSLGEPHDYDPTGSATDGGSLAGEKSNEDALESETEKLG
jgi:hypothetical protein